MELTDKQLIAYKDNENLCPICKSDDLWRANVTTEENNIAKKFVRCNNCHWYCEEIFIKIGVGKRRFDELSSLNGFEEVSFLWKMWLEAIKTTGDYFEALQYIEETLTQDQYKELDDFITWLLEKEYEIGHGNYYLRYQEYLNSKGE